MFVVDESEESHDRVADLARTMGVACRRFTSAEAFLDGFVPFRPGCVVAAIRLPGMSGLELQSRLAQLDDTLPVIILSAYVDVRIAVQAVKTGAFTVIEKPGGLEELSESIQRALDHSRAVQGLRDRQAVLEARFNRLDARDREVLELVLDGLPNKAIAARLEVSPRTLNRVRADVLRKMGATSMVELAQIVAELRCHGSADRAALESGGPVHRIDRPEEEATPHGIHPWTDTSMSHAGSGVSAKPGGTQS